MPRYFFNLQMSDIDYPDPEGREVRDLDHAREVAILDARDLIAADAKAGRLFLGSRIDIADEHGRVMLVVPFRDAIRISGIDAPI